MVNQFLVTVQEILLTSLFYIVQFLRILRSSETYLSADNNLWGKLVLSLESPIIFDESFQVASVAFFIADFNLLSCQLDNLHLHCYTESFNIDIKLKQNKFTILSQFPVKNPKWFFLLLQERNTLLYFLLALDFQ